MSDKAKPATASGYWSGMTTNMKGRLVAWLVYYCIAGAVFTSNAILGTVLLVAPGLWYILKNWLISEFVGDTDIERKDTLSGYTLRYLWNASIVTRVIMSVAGLAVILFGLGWISTEDFRAEAAKPTLAERVTDAAGTAAEVTKEKTGGWVQTAKGWFTSEETE